MKKLREIIEKIIRWWKPSAEGKNQTASGRRISAMWLTVLCYTVGRVWFMCVIHDADKLLIALGLDIVFIGLLWGFVNFQQIVELKNGRKETTTSTTIETKEIIDGSNDSNNPS